MELTLGLGSSYDSIDKARDDEEHDKDDGTQVVTVLLKGFDEYRSTGILLLRNPFESLVSAKAEQDILLQGSILNGPLWESEVRQKTYAWLSRAKSWICSAQSVQVVHYENLRKDAAKELQNILHFLDMVNTDQDRLDCNLKYAVRGISLKLCYYESQATRFFLF